MGRLVCFTDDDAGLGGYRRGSIITSNNHEGLVAQGLPLF